MAANTEWWRGAVLVAGFALTGAAAGTLGGRDPESFRPGMGGPIPAAAVVWELLGGLRTLGADAAWLQMHGAWMDREPGGTMAWLRMAVELNPESLFFRVNGARILAHDLPRWRVMAGGMPASAFRNLRREHAARALDLLAEGEAWHAGNPAWWIERAQIALNAADDPEQAADHYRRAALLPGAPHYAARLHAEMLLRLDRPAAAHAWLCRVHPTLAVNNPLAQSDRVLRKIRELEHRLDLPPAERYRPP